MACGLGAAAERTPPTHVLGFVMRELVVAEPGVDGAVVGLAQAEGCEFAWSGGPAARVARGRDRAGIVSAMFQEGCLS